MARRKSRRQLTDSEPHSEPPEKPLTMAPSTRSAALFAAFAVFLLVFTCTASALLVPPRVNAMLDLESNSGSKHAQSAAQLPLATDSTTNEAPIFLQRSPSTYEGHALVRIEVAGQRQKAKEVLDVLNAIDADIWAVQSKAEEGGVVFITARLSPEQRKLVEAGIGSGSTSNDVQVKLTIKHHNLQHVVDAESRQLLAASAESDDPANPAWFTQYHRYPAVLKFYKYLAEKNPDLVSVVDSVGKTHEGRNLFAVHLTSTKSNNTAPKKMIWWQSNIHAREWISGATTQYLIHTLVDEYKKGVDWVVELLDNVEIVLIPIVNPDGNEYTWTNSRLWRKNRNPTKFGAVGVDIVGFRAGLRPADSLFLIHLSLPPSLRTETTPKAGTPPEAPTPPFPKSTKAPLPPPRPKPRP